MTTSSSNTDERVTLVRSFDAELTAGDGRTLDMRVVPYNVPATVADPPELKAYQEMFLPGAFERQVSAPDRVRVWLNFEHDHGLRGIVGHGTELHDAEDGLRGSFRVHENSDGDKALQLVNDGLLRGVSMEFVALRSRVVEGVTQRMRAHIDKVSLCRFPAYANAEVLAVREGVVDDEEEESEEEESTTVVRALDPVLSGELSERLAALGIAALTRIATTSKPWDGSPARFTDEQYRAATLFCRPGEGPPKDLCSLPVLEPDGSLNTNALGAAAAALAGARGGLRNVSMDLKASAARKLVRLYGQANMPAPESVVALARK